MSTVARSPRTPHRHLAGRHLVGRHVVGRELVARTPTAGNVLVRLTLMSGSRRVDLVVPGAVPLAELVPELARSVGLLDAMTAYAGYRLVTRDGHVLSGDVGLASQGVVDGELVTVASGVEDEPPKVYDDVVEAMADAVRRGVEWDASAGRQAALWAGVVLLVLAAGALLIERGSDVAAAVCVVAAAMMVLGAVSVSRVRRETGAAVTLALVGSGYAAVAGLLLAWGTPSFGSPLVNGGAGALVAGTVAALGVGRSHSLLLPPVLLGGVLVGTGLLMRPLSTDAAVALTTVLVLVVMADRVLPWLALAATGTGVDRLLSSAGLVGDPGEIDSEIDGEIAGDVRPGETAPDEIDAERIAADARRAHEILVGLAATVGVLLFLVAPLAVSLGPAGTLVSVLACGVLMLRVRRYHSRVEVLVGLTSGFLGLTATALSVLLMHPSWRPGATTALAVTGAVLVARSHLTPDTFGRRSRLGDRAESLALLALPPALVTAVGVLSWIRG